MIKDYSDILGTFSFKTTVIMLGTFSCMAYDQLKTVMIYIRHPFFQEYSDI